MNQSEKKKFFNVHVRTILEIISVVVIAIAVIGGAIWGAYTMHRVTLSSDWRMKSVTEVETEKGPSYIVEIYDVNDMEPNKRFLYCDAYLNKELTYLNNDGAEVETSHRNAVREALEEYRTSLRLKELEEKFNIR